MKKTITLLFAIFIISAVSVLADANITRTFTTTGTWTVPVGVTLANIQTWGGGGAGGGATSTGPPAVGGGGGAGGAYARKIVTVKSGTVYTVTVATAVTGTTGNGATGNPSWFNSTTTVYAQGGAGGTGATTGTSGAGGTGSSALSIGTTVYAGGSGSSGANGVRSGAGGGGAGSTGAGGSASGTTAGTGTSLNGGNGGAGRTASNGGNPGNVYGGAGGGGYKGSPATQIGGDGAAGLVTVTYFNDTTAPVWVQTPTNRITWSGGSINYKVNATDVSGISKYWVNDTVNFKIGSATGLLQNNTVLINKTYWLRISVNDTYNNVRSTVINVTFEKITASLNKGSFGYWEESTATIFDNFVGTSYDISWRNSTGSVICSDSGVVPVGAIFKSCLITNDYGEDVNAYMIYNNTVSKQFKKVYFNITSYSAGDIVFLTPELKYGGVMYLGKYHGIETKVFINSTRVSNARCHLEITDEFGVPYSRQEAVSNGDGTIAFYGILDPDIYETKNYIYKLGCYCLDSTSEACIPDYAGMRGETQIAFEIVPWFENKGFYTLSSDVLIEGYQFFNMSYDFNWIEPVTVSTDFYLSCLDGFETYLQSKNYVFDNSEFLSDKVLVSDSVISSHSQCYLKTILYPERNFDVPHVFYSSGYFKVTNPSEYINISVSSPDIHLFDNYPIYITFKNPLSEENEVIVETELYSLSAEFFQQKGEIILQPYETKTVLFYLPLYEQKVVSGSETGWLSDQYLSVISASQVNDLNVTVLVAIEYNQKRYVRSFDGFALKRPIIINQILPVRTLGNKTYNSVFPVDYYGNVNLIGYLNATTCFSSFGPSEVPMRVWISPQGSIERYGYAEDYIVFEASNCSVVSDHWFSRQINLVGSVAGWYDVYYSYANILPAMIATIYVNGTIPNATVEERQLSVFESISTGIGGIIDKLAELIQVIADALGFKPFELHMSVSAPDYVHVGEYWDIYAVLTDQYDRTLSNYTCSVNTNKWGVLPMNYSNSNQRYEARKFVTTGGTLTWAVTC